MAESIEYEYYYIIANIMTSYELHHSLSKCDAYFGA